MVRLIINADDLGYEPNVSRGIIRSMREGVVSSATFMVNTPFTAAAAADARGLAIGLHLNLVRFSALTSGQELTEAEVDKLTPRFVHHEAKAQLQALERLLGQPATHLDVHRHAHLHPNVLEGVAHAARELSLPVRSISADMRRALVDRGVRTNDAFFGDAHGDAPAYWTPEVLEAVLDELPREGVVELMCHPGYAPAQLRSSYGAQREVELATFTSERARQALQVRGLISSSWSGL